MRESRDADYNLLKGLEGFEVVRGYPTYGTNGNLKSELHLDLGKWVSAPMLLARLCAGFAGLQITTGGQGNYKTTWEVTLRHKETGDIVVFYDYKGGVSYGTKFYRPAEAPKAFIEDLNSLVNALANDRFPHPYDGCVVGEEA